MNCLITGATVGIGKSICESLKDVSRNLYLVATNDKKLIQLKSHIESSSQAKVTCFVCDFKCSKDLSELIKSIESDCWSNLIALKVNINACTHLRKLIPRCRCFMISVNICLWRVLRTLPCFAWMPKFQHFIFIFVLQQSMFFLYVHCFRCELDVRVVPEVTRLTVYR